MQLGALVLLLVGAEPREGGRPAFSARLRVHVLDPATLRELGMPATFAAGDRVLVPRSAFDTLRRRGVPPRGFRLASKSRRAAPSADSDGAPAEAPPSPPPQFFTEAAPTHCQEGVVCAPAFVLEALGVREGEEVTLENAHFPKAAFVRFQAHSSKLSEHPEMEAMLTSTLEGFAALTKGTTIELRDGPNVYKARALPCSCSATAAPFRPPSALRPSPAASPLHGAAAPSVRSCSRPSASSHRRSGAAPTARPRRAPLRARYHPFVHPRLTSPPFPPPASPARTGRRRGGGGAA